MRLGESHFRYRAECLPLFQLRSVSAGGAYASIQIPVNAENRRLAKYAKHYSKLLVIFHVQMACQSIIMGSKMERYKH